jgi:hypothetical protein
LKEASTGSSQHKRSPGDRQIPRHSRRTREETIVTFVATNIIEAV